MGLAKGFVVVHLENFSRHRTKFIRWRGRNERLWACRACPGHNAKEFSDERRDRAELRTLCLDGSTSPVVRAIACMAWGGMRVSNGKTVWKERNSWLPIVEAVSNGSLNFNEAYIRFARKKIPGLGPAFFTKLIHFLAPDGPAESRGCIMDQWAAKSVNLLTGERIVTFAGGYVSRNNSADQYAKYCDVIQELAQRLSEAPDVIEEQLFSSGGRSSGWWRRYVISNWQR